jgi:hypothetical protein
MPDGTAFEELDPSRPEPRRETLSLSAPATSGTTFTTAALATSGMIGAAGCPCQQGQRMRPRVEANDFSAHHAENRTFHLDFAMLSWLLLGA